MLFIFVLSSTYIRMYLHVIDDVGDYLCMYHCVCSTYVMYVCMYVYNLHIAIHNIMY